MTRIPKNLQQGEHLLVKVADVDHVKPDQRGATINCYFENYLVNAISDEPAFWCTENADGSGLRYGFHEWLVESVEVLDGSI